MSFSALGPETIGGRLYHARSIHEACPDANLVSDQHIAEYERVGFLAIAGLFTAREVQEAKDGLRHLIAGGNPAFGELQFEEPAQGLDLAPGDRADYVRKLMDFTTFDHRLAAIARKPSLLAIVERLIGTRFSLYQEMALLKPPFIGREKPWHQDAAYFLLEPPEGIIGTWIALDEATPKNGCMHVIPGSHRDGPRPHGHDRDCQIADEEVDVEHATVVPLQPGGVLFFNSLLHHGTPPNRSSARRWALQFHYASVRCRPIDGPEHATWFFDRSGYAGCTGPQAVASDRSRAEGPG